MNEEKRELKTGFPRFIPIPINFTKTTDKPIDLYVYYVLSSYANWDTGKCFPSYETIQREHGISSPTFSKSIIRLEKLGLITTEKRTGQSTIYRVFTTKEILPLPPKLFREPLKKVKDTTKETLGVPPKKFNTNIDIIEHRYKEHKLIQDNESTDDRIETIWELYGRNRPKANKKNATIQITKAIKKIGYDLLLEKVNKICSVFDLYDDYQKKYIPMATTFFNQERYLDDISAFIQPLPLELKDKAYNSLENASESKLELNSMMNNDSKVKKLIICLQNEDLITGIDLMDQHLHSVVKLKGGWDELKLMLKNPDLYQTLMSTLKLVEDKDIRTAWIWTKKRIRPRQIIL